MYSIRSVFGLAICILSVSSSLVRSDLFPLSIIHINDFHARFEPTDTSGGTCDAGEECIGGYARTIHTVRRLLEEQKHNNALYLNAGDSFQGTLWYNVGRWNVTSQFLNMLPADAMTLGNHEFDHKIEGLVPFLETIQSPMLVANIDDSEEPTMNGLYQKSMIIERSGRKIGIIGVVLATFSDLADTGKLKFFNESEAIISEAQKLKQQGANIIIALTHCGYDVDQIIAENAGAEIDIIVGSHSHTFLYTGDVLPGPDRPRGKYPTEIIHKESGHRVLIVQAAAYAKYVGNITLFFDDNGDVVSYEGAPIYMGKDVKEDEEILQALAPWKEIIDEKGNVVVGASRVSLEKRSCDSGECNLGNFFADAMVHSFINASSFDQKDKWTNVSIGLINVGALRVPLYKGNLTYSHVVTMSPFENTLVAFNLKGQYLIDTLEYSVSLVDPENGKLGTANMLQVSGLRIVYNFKNPPGKRVQDVQVKCSDCDFPQFEPIDKNKIYRIVSPDFLTNGGDGFTILSSQSTDHEPLKTDIEAMVEYLGVAQPVTTGLEGRIKVVIYHILTRCNNNKKKLNIKINNVLSCTFHIATGDQSIKEALNPWKDLIDEAGKKVVGETKVKLEKFECSSRECNLGNFFTDAMVYAFIERTPYYFDSWSNVSIALTTQGNFRVPLEIGILTYAHLVTMCPFENKFVALNLFGKILWEVLEIGVASMNSNLPTPSSSRMLQVSGLRVTYNITKPAGKRVREVWVRCQQCKIPTFEKLDPEAIYRVVVADYLAEGSNGFGVIRDNAFDLEIGPINLDALIEFIKINNPITAALEGRIKIEV